MADITAKDVQNLRERTGVGIMDAKRALVESNGDADQAIELLKKQGALKAAKKADREAAEGKVFSYVHGNAQVGVLLQLNSETDFVARSDKFAELGLDICLHIAAMNPTYISREQIPASILEAERAAAAEQVKDKPVEIIEKIVNGKIDKFASEVTLLDQPFVKDDSKTIQDLLIEGTQVLGENIKIASFARFEVSGSTTVCSL